MGFLVRLTELDVSNNQLTGLPPDIVNLRSNHQVINYYSCTNLRFLDLAILDINHNSIEKLPESLGEFRKLQILHAQHNDIREIPDFTGCECIQEIYFGNNFIKVGCCVWPDGLYWGGSSRRSLKTCARTCST